MASGTEDLTGAESELAAARRQFAEVQRLAHLGSWEWDVLGDRITWSDELFRICGLEPQQFDATYDAYLELIHPDDREMVDSTVQEAYRTRQPYAFDHRLVRPDGSVRWLHGRGRVETDESGDVTRLHGVAIDITDQKRTEQLQRDFVANAAHDLRTPVTAVVEAVRAMASDDLDGDQRAEVFGILRRRVDGLLDLTNDLLDLAALHSGAETVVLRPTSVKHALDAALAAIDVPADGSLEVDVPDGVRVLANDRGLERAFRNLLSNAVRHGGDHVSVHARSSGDEVEIMVADDGPGVDPDIEHDLFVPFVMGKPGTAGSGLGLAIVDRLVRAFGGSVDYRRREPTGSEFRLRLEAAHGDAPGG